MSTENGSNLTLDDTSLKYLSDQFWSNLLWALYTPVVIATNSLVIVVIVTTKALHNKSHFVIASHSTVEAIYALVYFVLGTKRSVCHFLSIPETTTLLVCLIKQLSSFTGGNLVKYFTLALSVDRFLCITATVFYFNGCRTTAYVIMFNVICWAYALVKIPLSFIGIDKDKPVPYCTSGTPFNRIFLVTWGMEGYVMFSLTVGFYAVSAGLLLYRYKKKHFVGASEKNEWRKRMDLDVFKAMAAIGIAYVCTFGATALIAGVGSQMNLSLNQQMKLSLANQFLVLINATTHLFIYLWINGAFREAFFQKVKFNSKTPVVPMR